MADYDAFAEVYHAWAAGDGAYRAVELYSFFEFVGPVAGLSVLDLACGEGRISRTLIEAGARSVLGIDVSPEMVRRALAQGGTVAPAGGTGDAQSRLSYAVRDARDPAFTVDPPVDLVTAMYLFHYATSREDLQRMADLVARNLSPGGRLVSYTLNPDYDFTLPHPLLAERCGFDYRVLEGNRIGLRIGGGEVPVWQWSRAAHERCLSASGLTDIAWHFLEAPPDRADAARQLDFYLSDPSCVVLTASKPDEPAA